MAFTVERGATHRPLGFSAAVGDDTSEVARGGASGSAIGEAGAGAIVVERWAADQQGATAALLAPPDERADAAHRATRRTLASGLAEVRRLLFRHDGLHVSTTVRSPADRASAGAVDGFAPLAAALATPPATAPPSALATTRGIVDGELVSLLGLASGRLRPTGRSPLRLTVLTDARLDRATLEPLLREAATQALGNVAGLASALPGDGVLALANGLAQAARVEAGSLGFETLRVGMTALLQELVRALLEQAWLPAASCLVQVSVVGADDAGEAVAQAEALAASDELASAVAEALARPNASAARAGRFAIRRARDGQQVAVAIELGRGRSSATRWVALPR